MARKTRAKRANEKDPNPKQKMKSKLYINTREDDSQNTKRCGHCGASVRSEDKEIALQKTANAAGNVSAESLDSLQPAESRESTRVPSPVELPEWNGRRRRSGLEFADFFRRRWASGSISIDELIAAITIVQMKKDPNYSAPVQKKSRSRRNVNRQGHRSQGRT